MTNKFRPTHEIVFTPAKGTPTTYLVHLSDGSAYTRAEWESETAAAWEVCEGEWRHQGSVTPGGANGTVSVYPLGSGWTDTLIAAGHATHGVARTEEPVTTSVMTMETIEWRVYRCAATGSFGGRWFPASSWTSETEARELCARLEAAERAVQYNRSSFVALARGDEARYGVPT